jgi:hypothetical protein
VLVVHPILQCSATVLALYVLYLGINRFSSLHLKGKTVFRWKRHATLGYASLGTWLVGTVLGMTLVYVYWHGFLITGTHGKISLLMVPFLVFGRASGLYMDLKKKNRQALPLVHGFSNLIALILAVAQVVSGWWVYKVFVSGG